MAKPDSSEPFFLSGTSTMAEQYRTYDWNASSLGTPLSWSATLKSMVQLLLASTQPMFLVWGQEKTWLYNDAMIAIRGRKHPDALSRPIQHVWSEAWSRLGPLVKLAFDGEPIHQTGFLIPADRHGSIEDAYFNFSYTPMPMPGGQVEGLFGVCTETTGTVTASRDELATALEERDLIFDLSPDLIAVANFDGMLTSINPAWSKRLGRTDEFLLTHPFIEFIHPDDLAETGAVVAELIAGKPVHQFHVRLLTEDGKALSFAWSVVPGVQPGTFYTTGRDITEDVEREAELAARTAERDRLWTLSQDMFARANLEGMMSAVSPGWSRVLGWSLDELVSRPYATFMHDEDMGPTLAALARMGETGQPTRFQNRIATSDGEYKWIEWTVAPEPDGRHFIAVGRDLSENKTRETELLATQEALRQSQKMEAVGQLTGGIAHDFNNIIAGVSGSLEIMSTRLAQGRISEVERYLTAASSAIRRAASLTQRLLAFSRRQTLDPKQTNLNALVDGMLDLIHRSVGPEIQVETVGKAGLWPTFVDVGQLESSLLNLCINARDAMPEGGKITIETANRWMDERAAKERGLTPGQYVSMCVSDTGSGMPKDVIERAFDPFFTTKPIGQGTGLGLSMVHGFAGQSGGAVRIYSEIGAGTMVCIYLPRHTGDDARDTVEDLVTVAPLPEGQPVVMLVDDEPLVRMVAAEHLEELGYTVIEAGDAHEALRLLDSIGDLTLLITDVGLPGGMNGRQFAEIVKQKRPDLPVLFITGYAENAVLNHGHLAHGMHVMSKPFQMDAFASKVAELAAATSKR